MTGAEQGGLGDQTEAMLKMMKHIVETWGGSMDNFVKITNFLTDISEDATAASRGMRRK
jgi:enamine deaminase RidA (YjgF/YER057c/UK114 family)